MHAIKTFGFASLFAPLFILGCASTNSAIASQTQPNSASNVNPQETTLSNMPLVELETSMGNITIELNEEKAPKTVENFLNYVNSGHYEGTIFHRIIDGFMIQGGGMDAQMNEKKTNAPVENEADNGLKNDQGTIAMARTQDPHSATSQFFINVKDNDFLNHSGKNAQGWGYTVFGKVTSGMDVIEKMRGVPTGRFGMHADVPSTPVVINSAKVVSQ